MASLYTSQTPTGTNNSDGTPGITVGQTFRFSAAGQISAVRFFSTLNTGGTWTGAVWQVNNSDPHGSGGTLLASKVLAGAPTAGAWNLITLDTPVSVTTSALYRAGVHSSDGRYVNLASLFTSGLTNGDITSDADGSSPLGIAINQGVFVINAALSYPTSGFSSSAYFVDVDYTADGGDVIPPSVPTGLATTAIGSTTVDLSWTAASDNVGVTQYEVVIIGP